MNSKLKIILLIPLLAISYQLLAINLPSAFAQSTPPTSTNYKILNYGFGGGGTASSSSTGYSLFGTLGQVDQGSPASETYFLGAGLEYTMTASMPAAPTFTNPSNWYNKLQIVINRGGTDPSDYQYAIRIASGSGQFQYVQNDNTVSSAFPQSTWQTYTEWGETNGTTLVGLYPGTTYTVQVAARQSQFFTQSDWGPTAIASTNNSTLSFHIDVAPTDTSSSPPYIVRIGQLTPGSVTTATDKVWVSLSTNSNNGGMIYVLGTNSGLQSPTASHTIDTVPAKNDLSGVTEGYGAQKNTVSASEGSMEALSPYDGTGTTVGIIDTAKRTMFDSIGAPVTDGRVSFNLMAKAGSTTPAAADYADTITILAVGSF